MTKNQFRQFCLVAFGQLPIYNGKTKTFYITFKYSYELAMFLWEVMGKLPTTQVKNIVKLAAKDVETFSKLFKTLVEVDFNIEPV